MIARLIDMLRSPQKLRQMLIQFIKFGLVGVSNTLISLAIYYVLVAVDVDIIVANAIAFFISVLNAYYWNNKYVFTRTSKGHLQALLRTYAAYGATFVLGTAILYLSVSQFGISKYIAPIISLCFTIPINFLINRFWAFK